MKKKKTLIICMLLGIMLLTSCGKTDHQDQASVATEQTSGDSRQTTEELYILAECFYIIGMKFPIA